MKTKIFLSVLFFLKITVRAYKLPSNIQSLNDQAFVSIKSLDAATLEARNDKLQTDIDPAVHEYNVYWESFENSGTLPSESPLSCPSGYVQHPEDASGLKSNGGKYNHFHCYTEGVIDIFQAFLNSDFEHGWESAAVIWCAPVDFRDPNCLGMPQGSAESGPKNFSEAYAEYSQIVRGASAQIESYHYSPRTDNPLAENATKPDGVGIESAFDASGCSCVFKDEFMHDFQDYATFLANDLMGGMSGEFKHYVVWNEVANSVWMDLSPTISVTTPLSPTDQQKWINKYTQMVRAFTDNIQEDALVYISLDRWFGVPPVLTNWNIGRVHMGSQNMLIGIWNTIGTKARWSLGLHPYGGMYAREFNFENKVVSAYNPATIGDVATFQRQQLQRVDPGASTDPNVTPQLVIALTEQGFSSKESGNTPEVQAEKICQFHDLVYEVPGLYYVAHNDFQNSGNDPYGLVSTSAGKTLENSESSVTYQAYKATNPANWKKNAGNWCCLHNDTLGCP